MNKSDAQKKVFSLKRQLALKKNGHSSPVKKSEKVITNNITIQKHVEPNTVKQVEVLNPITEVTVKNPVTEMTVTNPVNEVTVLNPVSEVKISNPVTEVNILNPVEEVTIKNPVTEMKISNPVTEVEVTNLKDIQQDNSGIITTIVTAFKSLFALMVQLQSRVYTIKKIKEDFLTPQSVVLIDPVTGKPYSAIGGNGQDTFSVYGGMTGPTSMQIRNASDVKINPATEEKQDTIITAISNISLTTAPRIVNLQTDSVTSTISYIGVADPATDTSDATWQILKMDTTTGLVLTYADGNDNFDNIFDDRETLVYS